MAPHAFIQASDMICSTCGERLAVTDARCPVCGAAVTVLSSSAPPSSVRRCPRCRYVGEGVGYFRRTGHLLLLGFASLLTLGFGGFGGLVYWLVLRRHTVCPNCGFAWEDRVDSRRLHAWVRERRRPNRHPRRLCPPGV